MLRFHRQAGRKNAAGRSIDVWKETLPRGQRVLRRRSGVRVGGRECGVPSNAAVIKNRTRSDPVVISLNMEAPPLAAVARGKLSTQGLFSNSAATPQHQTFSVSKPRTLTCSSQPIHRHGHQRPRFAQTVSYLSCFRSIREVNATLEKFRHKTTFLILLRGAIRSTLGLASLTCLPPPACMSAPGS